MIVIGIDAHTRVHVAAAVDEQGRVVDTAEVAADPSSLNTLVKWVATFDPDRLVAVEGAKGFGLALTRRLLAAGETVVDIATHLTAQGRKSSRRRGKDDPGDAVVIARVALREPDLPRLTEPQLDADLKLLVDARDQLVAEATRVRNRLHALLLVVAPGYRDDTGALSNTAGLATAKQLVTKGRAAEPVRARLALAAIARLHQLEREARQLEADITDAVTALQPTRLLAICGVGPIVAAKILGETRGVERFPTAAAFAAHSGTAPCQHRAAKPHGTA
jgi:transposase